MKAEEEEEEKSACFCFKRERGPMQVFQERLMWKCLKMERKEGKEEKERKKERRAQLYIYLHELKESSHHTVREERENPF